MTRVLVLALAPHLARPVLHGGVGREEVEPALRRRAVRHLDAHLPRALAADVEHELVAVVRRRSAARSPCRCRDGRDRELEADRVELEFFSPWAAPREVERRRRRERSFSAQSHVEIEEQVTQRRTGASARTSARSREHEGAGKRRRNAQRACKRVRHGNHRAPRVAGPSSRSGKRPPAAAPAAAIVSQCRRRSRAKSSASPSRTRRPGFASSAWARWRGAAGRSPWSARSRPVGPGDARARHRASS